MLDHRGGEATGKLAIEPDVVVRDHVAHLHFGDDREPALVDVGDAAMRVRVDEPRRDVLAGGVDHRGPGGGGQPRAHAYDLARLHEQVRILEFPLRARRPHGGVAHQHGGRLRWRCRPAVLHRRTNERQIDLRHLHRDGAARGPLIRLGARALVVGIGARGQRHPAEELLATDRAGEQHRALEAQLLAVERCLQTARLGDDAHAGEVHRPAARHFDRATDTVERTLEAQRGAAEGALILGRDRPRAARVDLRGPGDAVAGALHPHVTDGAFLREEIALAHHEVGHLAH